MRTPGATPLPVHPGRETLGEARVVDDGDLVGSGNVTSGIDMALYLLEREVGPQIAHGVERIFRHERRGTVWRPAGPAVIAP
ncbi:hypothetical protein [Streptosporangium longisporum]|uniref:DJ-1/PfpI domain-containing protein n=1 Tax=Streptosporangium longisporum TaxID=46187 RepID=A0ABN3Y9C1_9ACTN